MSLAQNQSFCPVCSWSGVSSLGSESPCLLCELRQLGIRLAIILDDGTSRHHPLARRFNSSKGQAYSRGSDPRLGRHPRWRSGRTVRGARLQCLQHGDRGRTVSRVPSKRPLSFLGSTTPASIQASLPTALAIWSRAACIERATDDELNVDVHGKWANYQVSFT